MSTTAQLAKLSLFSGSVSATGNLIAQYLAARQPAANTSQPFGSIYDPAQSIRFFVYGMSFAPVAYRWHAFLNRRFPISTPATASATQKYIMVMKRMAVDQTVFAPLACASFVGGMGVLEGLGPKEIGERFRTRYPGILMAGYVLWPAAQLANFSLIPLAYRVHFGSMVSLFWNTYLGWTSNRAGRKAVSQEGSIASAKKSERAVLPIVTT